MMRTTLWTATFILGFAAAALGQDPPGAEGERNLKALEQRSRKPRLVAKDDAIFVHYLPTRLPDQTPGDQEYGLLTMTDRETGEIRGLLGSGVQPIPTNSPTFLETRIGGVGLSGGRIYVFVWTTTHRGEPPSQAGETRKIDGVEPAVANVSSVRQILVFDAISGKKIATKYLPSEMALRIADRDFVHVYEMPIEVTDDALATMTKLVDEAEE